MDVNSYVLAIEEINGEEIHDAGEIFMLNILYLIKNGGYRIDYLLAFVALMTWFKTIYQFRITASFGPMFKIIYKMFYDLGKFLVVWIMILLTFSCVSTLIFGKFKTFDNLQSTFLFYFQSSLGNWDVNAYVSEDPED